MSGDERALRRSRSWRGRQPPARGHAFVHLYYPDLWPELARYLARLPQGCRVAVNLVEGRAESAVAAVAEAFPTARILVSPNRGRDIGGFVRLHAAVAPDDADPIWLVHSKRSPHLPREAGDRWRRELIEPLLGSRRRAAWLLRRMAGDPELGIVAARRWRRHNLDGNECHYRAYLDRLGIAPAHRDCDFVGGTMMVLRAALLREIVTLLDGEPMEDGDAVPLAEHIDGQRAHAIERVIFNLARHRGYHVLWRRQPMLALWR